MTTSGWALLTHSAMAVTVSSVCIEAFPLHFCKAPPLLVRASQLTPTHALPWTFVFLLASGVLEPRMGEQRRRKPSRVHHNPLHSVFQPPDLSCQGSCLTYCIISVDYGVGIALGLLGVAPGETGSWRCCTQWNLLPHRAFWFFLLCLQSVYLAFLVTIVINQPPDID